MANGKGNKSEFEFFSADTANPLGKYTQPKPLPHSMANTGTDYPQTDIGLTGTKSKGRFIDPYGKKKEYVDMRGAGAATKGKKFYTGDEDMDGVKTKG